MRKILIVGAGQSGLQLALGLQSKGYEVTLMSNRTADEIRTGRVMSTQCMFHTALQHERDYQLNFWESQAPKIEGLGVSVAAPDSSRAVDWVGKLDGFAQSVDQRVKMAGWMETFAQRGGQLVIHGAAVSDLDYFSRTYDLVMVSAGKGELVSMFGRDAARSPFDAPQRALAVAYVHGMGPRPEHPEFDAVRCNLVPGVGELFVMPTLTTSGRADILFVRKPLGRLPGGGLVLGVADVVVANDPITGQGSNSASKCANAYLDSIVEHGEKEFDAAWMQSTFDRYWETAQHVTKWTNAMLGVPPEHVLNLIGAAGQLQPAADRFANGFNNPADFENFFYEPEKTNAYLASVTGS
ncbi:oxygenase [Streptomyces albus subsp. albus]|nr:oxygenase [Streptomyces albus subsp. albus]